MTHITPPRDARSYGVSKPVSPAVTAGWCAARPDALELAILSAVMYAAIFDFPLTLRELRRSVTTRIDSTDALRRMLNDSHFLRAHLTLVDDWILPSGRTDLVATRARRERASRAFLALHHGTLALLASIPFTRLVAISGSLAHLNAEADQADLDLFVVASPGHVWTVAVLMIIAARLLGRRDVTCVNFVVGADALSLKQADYFTASQILSLRPVTAGDTFGAFLEGNPCVRDWFPNADAGDADFPVRPDVSRPGWRRSLEALLWLPGSAIERCCRAGYGWHLRRRTPSWQSPDQVTLESNVLKLHTRSHRHDVLARHARMMERAISGDTSLVPADACLGSS